MGTKSGLYECDWSGCDWTNPDWRYGFADAGATWASHVATEHSNRSARLALESAICRVHHAREWSAGTIASPCAACVVATDEWLKSLEAQP